MLCWRDGFGPWTTTSVCLSVEQYLFDFKYYGGTMFGNGYQNKACNNENVCNGNIFYQVLIRSQNLMGVTTLTS